MLHSGCFYSNQASWIGTSQMYVSSHRYSSVNKREAEAEDQDQWPYRAHRPSPYLFCHHGKFAALWTTLLRPRLTNELASRSLCRYYRGTHWPAITAASPQNKQVNPAPIPSQIRAWSQSSRDEDALLWCSHLREDTPAMAGHQRSLPADCPLHLPAWLNSRAYRPHTQEQDSDVHTCQAPPDGEKALCRGFTSEGINLFWLDGGKMCLGWTHPCGSQWDRRPLRRDQASHSLPGAVSPSNSHLLEGEETQRHLCTLALGTATEVLNITCRQQVTFHHTHLRVELLINNSPHTEKLIRFLLCRNNELHY